MKGRKSILYLAIVASLVIIIVIGLKSSFFTQGTPIAKVEKNASQEMNHKIVIPKYKHYPILTVLVRSGPYNRKTLGIDYGIKKGKLNQKALNAIKNHQNEKVLYGIYSGQTAFSIQFNADHTSLVDSKIKMINGEKISYKLIKRPGFKGLVAIVNVKKGCYTFQFNQINHQLTQKDAYHMIGQLIQELK